MGPFHDTDSLKFVVYEVNMLIRTNHSFDSLSIVGGKAQRKPCPFNVENAFFVVKLQANVSADQDSEVFNGIPF